MKVKCLVAVLIATAVWAKSKNQKETPALSPLNQYIEAARSRATVTAPSAGSLFSPDGRISELARDLRASRVDDIVTIVVADKASAVSRGGTNSARAANARASVTSAALPARMATQLANVVGLGSDQKLQGQGETTRESELTTTLSARVVEVLPNGNMVLEGTKEVQVNSERQRVVVRGVARWNDLTNDNQVRSDRLAQLEVWIDGRGVVNDSIRRPNILYRILLGILPF